MSPETDRLGAPHQIAGIILAAGESRRMAALGVHKALLSYRGRSFLEGIIFTLREAGIDRIVVVLGHHAEAIQQAVNLQAVEVVVNRDYARGQTSSLQEGLKAIERGATAGAIEAIVLLLVDHPAVSADTVRKLVEGFARPHPPLVIPTFEGQRGHPVLISRRLFKEILELGPDEGASTVIRKYRSATQWIEVDDAGILADIDDPDSYSRLAGG